MAGSLNKVMLIGRLGQDPKRSQTNSGQAVANFTMATDEGYRDRQSGDRVERTEWHRVVCWRNQAEFAANYLGKGRLVYVEGRLQTRKWQDQNGQDRYTTEIVANTVQGLDRDPDAQQGGYQQRGGYQQGPQGGAPQGRPPQQPQQQGGYGNNQQQEKDLGPEFPSDTSGMDDVPF